MSMVDATAAALVEKDAELSRFRAALLWAFDRLSVDGGIDHRAQYVTAREIGKVLLGQPSPAARYAPEVWSASSKLVKNA